MSDTNYDLKRFLELKGELESRGFKVEVLPQSFVICRDPTKKDRSEGHDYSVYELYDSLAEFVVGARMICQLVSGEDCGVRRVADEFKLKVNKSKTACCAKVQNDIQE